MKKELPRRKYIRLNDYDYSSPGAYFITICNKDRRNSFWTEGFITDKVGWITVGANCVRPQNLPLSRNGEIVRDELEKWNTTYSAVSLNSYVIMPNHIHIIVSIYSNE
ncbi:MAG: hypothetical protein J6L92_08925, partial [Clostridia bacterium]|nr:hypothetical protein [Clostridia bacterium]